MDDGDNGLIGLAQLLPDLLVDYDFPADPPAAAEARRRIRYSNLWLSATSGEVPTERRGRGLFVRRADRSRIAAVLGLLPRITNAIAA
jgi:hypothetical protein